VISMIAPEDDDCAVAQAEPIEFCEDAADVPDGLRIPRWSWNGLQA